MSKVNVNEIASLLKEQIKAYKEEIKTEVVGTVVEVGDGIAKVYGLDNAMQSELIAFPNGVYGTVLDLAKDYVGVILFGETSLTSIEIDVNQSNYKYAAMQQDEHVDVRHLEDDRNSSTGNI